MKCKYGKYNGFEENVMGIVDLDNLDITDLNFKTSTPEMIFFYNLAKKLTERGEAKMRGLGLYCNECNKDSFIYILPDEPLTNKQLDFKNKKRFIEYIVNGTQIDSDDRTITNKLLLDNGWELKNNDFIPGENYIYCIPGIANLQLTTELSNMLDRDWYLHIDNDDFETIGSADIQTIDHFNKMMEVLDIDYRL